MISNGKKRQYLAVTSLSALLQGKSSNHKEDFYIPQKVNLKNMKKYVIITIAAIQKCLSKLKKY